MARATVNHSEDAVTIVFKGDKKHPEPSTGIIKFPGGHVEVSRCSDDSYWAHIYLVSCKNNVDSRYQYDVDSDRGQEPIQEIPDEKSIQHIAVRVASREKWQHFD